MGQKGRPVTKPPKLKDGFYLEVGNIGSVSKVKLRKNSMFEVDLAVKQFDKVKEATFLGEVKDGMWISGKNKGKSSN